MVVRKINKLKKLILCILILIFSLQIKVFAENNSNYKFDFLAFANKNFCIKNKEMPRTLENQIIIKNDKLYAPISFLQKYPGLFYSIGEIGFFPKTTTYNKYKIEFKCNFANISKYNKHKNTSNNKTIVKNFSIASCKVVPTF